MLQLSVDWLVYSFLGMDPLSGWGQAVNFFIYDSLKILVLLFVLISLVGFLRSFLPMDKIRVYLSARTPIPNIISSVFGALTPFCSCSSIPVFFSFLRAQVPLGAAFSFLITSPLVNEYLVVLMLGFFGLKITLLYVFSGITIGTLCGIFLGRMNLERFLESDLSGNDDGGCMPGEKKGMAGRLASGVSEALSIIKKLWVWILAGVGLGSIIHNFVPQELVRHLISRSGIFNVPIAAAAGVPMYGNCAAIVPIAVALFQKGLPLGTALAFMMAVSALSLPEAIMLRRAMHLKLIAVFFLTVASAIVFTGYLFNFLQKILV
ncbi:MAG: permease [Candidatus Omnitrophica bacterium]|nr:permease [Candidatus Omnitrophota bacterium]